MEPFSYTDIDRPSCLRVVGELSPQNIKSNIFPSFEPFPQAAAYALTEMAPSSNLKGKNEKDYFSPAIIALSHATSSTNYMTEGFEDSLSAVSSSPVTSEVISESTET